MTQFDKRNITMMMDFYEMTMAHGYFKDHDKDVQVAFDVFYRANPDEAVLRFSPVWSRLLSM